jgi:DNA-binding NarL/FixJ family response regulator
LCIPLGWPEASTGSKPGRLSAAANLQSVEAGVGGLIAAGATNRDAAAALFVSVRTVETHVASIYRKLGVRTRAELARRMTAGSQ